MMEESVNIGSYVPHKLKNYILPTEVQIEVWRSKHRNVGQQ